MNLTQTVSLTDYQLIKPTLAKVIVATSGSMDKDTMAELLCAKLKYLAAPVENSFRKLTSNSAIGFIRANKQTRDMNPKLIKAQYKVMSSNILMDKQDRTLWEVKSGPTGSYITRKGNEDLSELVEASVHGSRMDVPSIRRVTLAKAAKGEFVAYCNANGNMDHGFVTRSNDNACEIVSAATKNLTVIPNKMIAGIYPVSIDRAVHQEILSRVMTADEKQNAVNYWKSLFSYAPEYAEELVNAVNDSALM